MRSEALTTAELPNFYAPYVGTLGNVDLLETLEKQYTTFATFIESISESKMDFKYGANKWTVGEVLLHLNDAERVFQYRAMRIARGDNTPLPGFDENAYADEYPALKLKKKALLEDYLAVRKCSLTLFSQLNNAHLKRMGRASNAAISVAAIGFIICGHQEHHKNVLESRYGVGA